MSGEMQVLDAGQATDLELAEVANREHEGVGRAAGAAVDHAIKAGEALIQAKGLVEPDEWEEWIARNCRMKRGWVDCYIRLATYKDVIFQIPSRETLTITEALRVYLRGLPSASPRQVPIASEIREEGQRLLESGMSPYAVAKLLGVHKNTANRWAKGPEWGRSGRAIARRRRERERAKEALQREQRARAMRKVGGEVAKGWNHIVKAAQELDRARLAEEDPEAKRKLAEALSALYTAEDATVAAGKVSQPKAA